MKSKGLCGCFHVLCSSYRFYFAFLYLLIKWTSVKIGFAFSGDCSIASRMLCWSSGIAA